MAIVPKPATGLGKFPAKPVYDGDSPRKSGAYAKTGGLRPAWGNFLRNPFIMAIARPSAIVLAKPSGLAKPFGLAKHEGTALVLVAGAIDDNRPQILVSPFHGAKEFWRATRVAEDSDALANARNSKIFKHIKIN